MRGRALQVLLLLGALAALMLPATASARPHHHCGHVTPGSYYSASHITATHIRCHRARRVAAAAARTISAIGIGPPQAVGFVVLHKTWGCYFHARYSDAPFRVHCGPQDTGNAHVNFTASPGE
jgi:hypothetical protein